MTLAGRKVRVVNPDEEQLRQILAQADVVADVRAVPATIEERMTVTV